MFKALSEFEVKEKIYSMAECGGETTCVIPIKSLVNAGRVLSSGRGGCWSSMEALLRAKSTQVEPQQTRIF